MDRGKIQVLQPDVGRVGGLTEAMRVCALARDGGRTIVPHAGKTGISIAAAAHMAAAAPHCAFIEFSPLRKDLASHGLRLENGEIQLPTKPGLGVELNRDALDRFAFQARRRMP